MKAFFAVNDSGDVTSVTVSKNIVPTENGYVVDVPKGKEDEIDKFELVFVNNMPKLRLKEGEELNEIEETEEEKEIRELEERLNELKNKQ